MKNEWDVDAAISTYNVDGWGTGYFTVNAAGNAEVRPLQEKGGAIDILEVVNEARSRGLGFPLVIRFQDLLRHRVESVNCAFQKAIEEFGYKNHYRGVFPIKVNQLREVVEEIVDAGQEFHFGLEAGSKPELVAALAMHKDPESLIICNGYKDRAFIRIALLGRKLGKKVIIVVEKLEELEQTIRAAKEVGVEPMIGIRVRLYSKGAGKWSPSGGENAKFGLDTTSLVAASEMLKAAGLAIASSSSISMSARRCRTSPRSSAPCAKRRAITRSSASWAMSLAISMSAADSASITTARAATSTARRTTRFRNTRATSSGTSWTSAMPKGSRIRRS